MSREEKTCREQLNHNAYTRASWRNVRIEKTGVRILRKLLEEGCDSFVGICWSLKLSEKEPVHRHE